MVKMIKKSAALALALCLIFTYSGVTAFADEEGSQTLEGSPAISADAGSVSEEVKAELESKDLLNVAEGFAKVAEEALGAVEAIVNDEIVNDALNELTETGPPQVDGDNIEDAANVVNAAGNAVDEANNAIAAAEKAVEAAQGAIALAEKAQNVAEAITEAANEAIAEALLAEEAYREALLNSDDKDAIEAAELKMIEKRDAAMDAQEKADKAEAEAKDAAWSALEKAIDAYVAAISEYESALEADTDAADAAQAKLAAEKAIAEALNAQLSADMATVYANAVIRAANKAVGDANTASILAGDLAGAANEIILAVEDYIVEEIFEKSFDDIRDMSNATYEEYLEAYYDGVITVAKLYGIDVDAGFKDGNPTVEGFYCEINRIIGEILKYNEEAYAKYMAAQQRALDAYNRAHTGTPEPTFSEAIHCDGIILATVSGSGDGPYQGSYNGRFTPEFTASFEKVLLNYWEANGMYQDLTSEELKKKALEIASGKALNMGTVSSPNFYEIVNLTGQTFTKDSDGNYIYTMKWNTDQGKGLDSQQVIAVDWYTKSGDPKVVSYIFILEGKYEKGDEIQLIFTPEMYATMGNPSYNNFVVKRIAYDEPLGEIMMENLQMLPMLISVVPGLAEGTSGIEDTFAFNFGAFKDMPGPDPGSDNDPGSEPGPEPGTNPEPDPGLDPGQVTDQETVQTQRDRNRNGANPDPSSSVIDDQDVPLSALPEDELIIIEEDVPLADIPQTGLEDIGFSMMLLGVSLSALIAMLFGRRKAQN